MHSLSAILSFACLIMAQVLSYGQMPGFLRFNVDDDSYVVINGKTNVNKFQCQYKATLGDQDVTVKLASHSECIIASQPTLKIDVGAFDCEHQMMNKDLRHLLQYEQYPYITCDVVCMRSPQDQAGTDRQKTIVTVKMTIAGVSELYDLPLEVYSDGNRSIAVGDLSLDIRDFKLAPPKKMLGMVVVHPVINIDFFIKFSLQTVTHQN